MKSTYRSALALMAGLCLAAAASAQPAETPELMQAFHKTAPTLNSETLTIKAAALAPAVTQRGAFALYVVGDQTADVNSCAMAPAGKKQEPMKPGKSGGGKKKCIVAAGPGDEGEDQPQPSSLRRLLT